MEKNHQERIFLLIFNENRSFFNTQENSFLLFHDVKSKGKMTEGTIPVLLSLLC